MPTAKKSWTADSRPSPGRSAKAKAIKAIAPTGKKGKTKKTLARKTLARKTPAKKTPAKKTTQTPAISKLSASAGGKAKSDDSNKKKDDDDVAKKRCGKIDTEEKDADTTKDVKSDATKASDNDEKDVSQQKPVSKPIDYEPIIAKAVTDISAQAGSASAAVPLDEIYNYVKSSVDRLRFADISFFRAVERMLDKRQLDEVGASYHDCNEMMKDLLEADKDAEGEKRGDSTDKEDDDDETGKAKAGGVKGKDQTEGKSTKGEKEGGRRKAKRFGAGYANRMIRICPQYDKDCETNTNPISLQSHRGHSRVAHSRRLLTPELAKAFVDSDRARQHKKYLIDELAKKKKLLVETKARIEEIESSMIDASDQVVETDQAVEKAELNIPCKWNEMYLRLIEYRERFGHCLPLKRYARDDGESELAEWCKEQRYIFANGSTKGRPSSGENKTGESGDHATDGDATDGDATDGDESDENGKSEAVIEGQDSVEERHASNNDLISRLTPLDKIRKSLLERIGFMWDFQEGLWQKFYRDLLDYKAIHGNCDVKGKRNGPKTALAAWVGRQRTANRARLMLKAGKKAGDDGENQSGEDTSDCIDEETKALLIEGGIGISTQVESCKKYNTIDALTDEQFRLLVEAGFDFNPYGNSWDRRYQELLDYKEQYGDCLVPQQFPQNQSLAIWVRKQQEHYKLMQEGKKNPLNPERFELLQKVGFVFQRSARKPRKSKKMKTDGRDDGSMNTSGAVAALPTDSMPAQVAPKKRGRPRGKKRKAEESISNEVTETEIETMPEQNVNVQDNNAGQGQAHHQVSLVERQDTQLHDWLQQQSHQQQEIQREEPYDQQRQQQFLQQQQQQFLQQQQQVEQQLEGDRQPELLQRVVDSQNHRQWLNANNSQIPAPTRPMWGFTDQNVDNRLVASGMTASLLQQVGAAYGTGHGLPPSQDNLLPRQNNVTAPGQVGDVYENVDKQVFDPSLLYQ